MNFDEIVLLDLNNFDKARQLVQAVLSGQYRVIVYGGAVRGGKTFNLLGALVLLLRAYPGARAAITRRDLETLKRNTLPTCKKVFPSNFLELTNSTSYIWRGNNHLEKYGGHTHRSEVFFFGENYDKDKELARWDGLEVNFIILDQIEELREPTFSKAIERVGSYVIPGRPLAEQPLPIILASCNPTKNWVKRMIYDPWKAGKLPEDWLYIPATVDENPHIPEAYIQNLEILKRTNPEEYRRRRWGDWNYVSGDNLCFDPASLEDMFTNSFVPAGRHKYITADIAMKGADHFTIGVWNGWRLEQVYYYPRTDGREVLRHLQTIARQHGVPYKNIAYDAQGVGDFLGGWLRTSYAYRSNARPIPFPDDPNQQKPNYGTLRDQSYIMMGDRVNDYQIFAQGDGFAMDRLQEELEAHHIVNADQNRPLKVTPKADVAAIIGRSPDFSDMFVMRNVFDLQRFTRSRTRSL